MCSFNVESGDPAARWLKDKLTSYAASDEFAPSQSLTLEQLQRVLNAPLLSGARDDNRARNPQDPSSAVRADEFAQP